MTRRVSPPRALDWSYYHKLLKAANALMDKGPSQRLLPSPSSSTSKNSNPQDPPIPDTPITTPLFPLHSLPPAILLPILRRLHRHDLKLLLETRSLRLKSAANLVLTEEFVLGISEFYEVEPFDAEQIGRKMVLCASVKGDVDGKGVQGVGGRMLLGGRGVGMLGGSTTGVRRNGIEGTASNGLYGPDRCVNVAKDEDDQISEVNTAMNQTQSHKTTEPKPTTTTNSPAGIETLPTEILLPILEPQSNKLLKSLLSCRPSQLRRVAETILFERRREEMTFPTCRRNPGDRRSERGLWPAINEKGEEYLGWKFVLVGCGREGDCWGQVGKREGEEEGFEGVSLGSYWRVICKDVDVGRVTVGS